jgi:Zn-finger nucleic acid-binding protein
MLCPHCKTELKIADRQGIEVDYCPRCRGVWLDRGELDKILERSQAMSPAPGTYAGNSYTGYELTPQDRRYRHDDDDDDDDRHYSQPGYGRPGYQQRRRRSWLGDLFDFD